MANYSSGVRKSNILTFVLIVMLCYVFCQRVETTKKKIAFVSERDGNKEIYIMNPDGTNQRRLTTNPKLDYYPLWSPDGKKIAFIRSSGELAVVPERYVREIWIMNQDGSNQKMIATVINYYFWEIMGWSPDGQQIIYYGRGPNNKFEVYKFKIDKIQKQVKPVREINDIREGFVLSPDGKKIAFVTKGGLYIQNSNRRGIKKRIFQHHAIWDIVWSPDSNKLAFTTSNALPAFEMEGKDIYIIDVNGENLLKLAEYGWTIRFLQWSPDGKYLVYVVGSTAVDKSWIYTIDLEKRKEKKLCVGDECNLSPDGKTIVFQCGKYRSEEHIMEDAEEGTQEIYTIDITGKNKKRLTNNNWYDGQPVWQP